MTVQPAQSISEYDLIDLSCLMDGPCAIRKTLQTN